MMNDEHFLQGPLGLDLELVEVLQGPLGLDLELVEVLQRGRRGLILKNDERRTKKAFLILRDERMMNDEHFLQGPSGLDLELVEVLQGPLGLDLELVEVLQRGRRGLILKNDERRTKKAFLILRDERMMNDEHFLQGPSGLDLELVEVLQGPLGLDLELVEVLQRGRRGLILKNDERRTKKAFLILRDERMMNDEHFLQGPSGLDLELVEVLQGPLGLDLELVEVLQRGRRGLILKNDERRTKKAFLILRDERMMNDEHFLQGPSGLDLELVDDC
ncbi:uncharacterized protein LOC126607846 [Malus sylvestris]|uniref:uncharacterized protein LOC126607846 n=1 Tax=Malus sylvestris TaxID=3752 RepID=UPI0021ACB804|nr:uncharacterized protein LOC126607846 [Malus sylvestris]